MWFKASFVGKSGLTDSDRDRREIVGLGGRRCRRNSAGAHRKEANAVERSETGQGSGAGQGSTLERERGERAAETGSVRASSGSSSSSRRSEPVRVETRARGERGSSVRETERKVGFVGEEESADGGDQRRREREEREVREREREIEKRRKGFLGLGSGGRERGSEGSIDACTGGWIHRSIERSSDRREAGAEKNVKFRNWAGMCA